MILLPRIEYLHHFGIKIAKIVRCHCFHTFSVDCKWSPWSLCDKECGEGYRTRSHEVIAQHGGQYCTGEKKESCKIKECPG